MYNSINKLPTFYIPHGGGPWHVMDDSFGDPEGYSKLRKYLIKWGKEYSTKTKAILIISAHWEEDKPTIHFGEKPPLFFDYYGFPESTYKLKWTAPGNSELALKIENLLRANGFSTKRELYRGFDHGTFVPLMISFPEAKIPIVQLSLVNTLEPSTHISIGKVLEPLRSEGVLIIGSGMSYHNMSGFISVSSRATDISKQFDDWLKKTVEGNNIDERNRKLINWRNAKGALDCHPRSEHLTPLFVVAGASGNDKGILDFNSKLMNINVSGYKFG